MSSLCVALLAACPDCAAGSAARALVFSETFWVNSWYALLPFVIVGAVVSWFVRHVDRGVGHERSAED